MLHGAHADYVSLPRAEAKQVSLNRFRALTPLEVNLFPWSVSVETNEC
ncbi:MAG: hypothetical protein ACTS7I_02620 [Candidatus Hodgkinia cicadicola]